MVVYTHQYSNRPDFRLISYKIPFAFDFNEEKIRRNSTDVRYNILYQLRYRLRTLR